MQSFVCPHLACHLPTIPDLLQRHGHYGTHSQVTTHHVHIQKKHVAEIQRQFVSLLFVVPCVPKATHMSNLWTLFHIFSSLQGGALSYKLALELDAYLDHFHSTIGFSFKSPPGSSRSSPESRPSTCLQKFICVKPL